MNSRRRVFALVVILSCVAAGACGTTLSVLYRVAVRGQRSRLVEIVQTRARLLEAMARFEAQNSPRAQDSGSYAATLSQVREAHRQFEGFGRTGEFTLAKREGDNIVFLLSHRHMDLESPEPIPWDSDLAQPMRLALLGKSGTTVGLDYRGQRVLAAYEPVRELGLGIVSKIDMAEVRAPFIGAGLLAATGSAVLILIGTLFFFRVVNPMVERLEQNEGRLNLALASAGAGAWDWDVV
jgi:hypothetical protein